MLVPWDVMNARGGGGHSKTAMWTRSDTASALPPPHKRHVYRRLYTPPPKSHNPARDMTLRNLLRPAAEGADPRLEHRSAGLSFKTRTGRWQIGPARKHAWPRPYGRFPSLVPWSPDSGASQGPQAQPSTPRPTYAPSMRAPSEPRAALASFFCWNTLIFPHLTMGRRA